MKKVIILIALLAHIITSPFCCNGDGCPNSLIRYVDTKGKPTGRYGLLDENLQPLKIKIGASCKCLDAVGTKFPFKTCQHCVEAICPNPDCGHHIFQHTCALNVRAEPGTGIIELEEEKKVRELKPSMEPLIVPQK